MGNLKDKLLHPEKEIIKKVFENKVEHDLNKLKGSEAISDKVVKNIKKVTSPLKESPKLPHLNVSANLGKRLKKQKEHLEEQVHVIKDVKNYFTNKGKNDDINELLKIMESANNVEHLDIDELQNIIDYSEVKSIENVNNSYKSNSNTFSKPNLSNNSVNNKKKSEGTNMVTKKEYNQMKSAYSDSLIEKNSYVDHDGYQFTALGLSGSGKTCFMAGMYYKMTGGIEGYTLKADDDDALKLELYYEKMMDSSLGKDRYPAGTNQNTDYAFELQHGFKTLEKFRWIDYAGGALKNKNAGDADEYIQLKKDISKSEMLYIFVDGELFLSEEIEECNSEKEKIQIFTDIVADNCARKINHFLSEYTSERQKLPPIAIVVTKYDLVIKALGRSTQEENKELLYIIIRKAFNPLFPDPTLYVEDNGHEKFVTVIPVSLGSKISEENHSGKLRPINMHLPAYIGIWFMLRNKNSSDSPSVKKLSDAIEDSGLEFWLNGQRGKFSTIADAFLKKTKVGV